MGRFDCGACKRLAQEQGIDPQHCEAMRKFDRQRPEKMSNEVWYHLDEADAKIGPQKDGAIDMLHQPEIGAAFDLNHWRWQRVRAREQAFGLFSAAIP